MQESNDSRILPKTSYVVSIRVSYKIRATYTVVSTYMRLCGEQMELYMFGESELRRRSTDLEGM